MTMKKIYSKTYKIPRKPLMLSEKLLSRLGNYLILTVVILLASHTVPVHAVSIKSANIRSTVIDSVESELRADADVLTESERQLAEARRIIENDGRIQPFIDETIYAIFIIELLSCDSFTCASIIA